MELKKRQEERRLMCKCQDGSVVDNESQCDECSSSSTLEDAIETLSKECIKSQESKIMKFKGVFAKTSLLLAVKLDNLYKKKAFAIKASKILGCPSTDSTCYDEACEHIDSAVSAIGPVRGRKLQVNDHPWTSPNSENAELLEEDPGIWVIPNFLNNDDTIKLANLLEKYRDDTGPSPCSRTAPDGRNCIYFTETDVINNYEEDEAVFYSNIRNKVQALWPQLNLLETNGIYDVPKDKTDPFGYHWDHSFESTTLIFLSDNDDGRGGNFVFPFAGPNGVTVTPKKGTVLTWLSRRSDGEMNKSHAHGIQATAPGSSQLISVHNFARGNTSVQVEE